MAPKRPSASYLTDTLPTVVPPIFEQAQTTTANHRKNIVQLRKVHQTCAEITEETPKGTRIIGEKAFNSLFISMVNRILPIKKGVAVADRIVKFIASYVTYMTEQENEEEEGVASRFVSKLLRHLLSGMDAKDKNVRFRVTLMTVSLLNALGEIDDDLYYLLRQSMLNRARDKEAAVRVQAALGLAKLQSGEDPNDLEEGQEPLAQVLVDLLRYDPSAEVRRAALYNMPPNPVTSSLILARSRDVDPLLRRTVYHGSFSATSLPDMRMLSIAQREEAVSNGLGDREPSVRKAAAGMIGAWLDQCEGDLLEFLSRFDVVSSEVAEDALLSVFVTRPEVLDTIELGDEWWSSLTPEKAFLARVFAQHCQSTKDEVRLEDVMPVVTALAFRIQDEYNKLAGLLSEEDEASQEQAFLVGELLRLALTFDYADEIGRRKMFTVSREMIAQFDLPAHLIPRCLDVLSKISNGERDLIRLIVDVVTELREGDGDVEMTEAQTPSRSTFETPARTSRERSRVDSDDAEGSTNAALTDLRCLLICISLLERVNTPLQDNSVFHGLLPDLIIPAVRNTDEPALRDQGLVCLGLCCMIDAKMAASSFPLFIQQLTAADDELKVKVVQVIFDLLMVHDIDELLASSITTERLVDLVRHMLAQDEPPVQAAACEGAAKLMLSGMVTDVHLLQSLVLLYFSPETTDNQPLRQCLTYFLPVYCYSARENQRRMLDIFEETFTMLAALNEEFEDATDLLPLSQMGLMMVDWLDPSKAVGELPDYGLHLDLAIELLRGLLSEASREVRKTLASFLGKLSLPEDNDTDSWAQRAAYQLARSVKEKRPPADATSRNALSRFEAALVKRFPALGDYDEEAFRLDGQENEVTSELFGFIDDVEERVESPERSTRRSSRATSRSRRTASETPSVADSDASPQRRPSRRPKTAPVAEESEEEDDEDVDTMLDSDDE